MDKWINENYQILQILGSGGHGAVFLAQKKKEKLKLSRLFAIKEYKKENLNLSDFADEVEILSHLKHPNICDIYNAFETESSFKIEMEYIEGCTIREYLDVVAKKNIPFGIGEGLQILEPIIEALIYAHEHEEGEILHKDICTNNIMISKTGKVTLIDFGIGQLGNKENKILQGKPAFLPDSVISGQTKYSEATDFYSLGVVAYNLFTGQKIRGEKDIQIDNLKDKSIKEIVQRLLNYDGDNQKILELVEDAQFEFRGKLKKTCRLVFDKKFKGEKKIIPKNILKFSFLDFFGYLESFKDEIDPNQTKIVRGAPPWKRRKIVFSTIVLTLIVFAALKLVF
jgi:serine/threonine protein kinase